MQKSTKNLQKPWRNDEKMSDFDSLSPVSIDLSGEEVVLPVSSSPATKLRSLCVSGDRMSARIVGLALYINKGKIDI